MSAAKKMKLADAPQWRPAALHFKLPHGIFIHEATSVAVNSKDEVFVFNRGNMPVLVFDVDGNLVRHWGNDTPFDGTHVVSDPYGNKSCRWIGVEFCRPHAVTVDYQDNLWLVDDSANVVTKCDGNGKRLMLLCAEGVFTDEAEMAARVGKVQTPGAKQSGARFNRPTDVAVNPKNGEFFVTDGYGNSRVHRFKADGTHIMSWGEPGTDPGQFNLPHNVAMHPDEDKIIVADRENSRVQIFTVDGEFVEQWPCHRAVAVATAKIHDKSGKARVLVAEQGTSSRVQKGDGLQVSQLGTWTPNIGHRIGVYDRDGTVITNIGASTPGERPEQFNWLHSVAVNSKGDIYAAEVSFCECGRHQEPHARELVSLRKWEAVTE